MKGEWLVVPDIHEKAVMLQDVLHRFSGMPRIFTGDWFDSFEHATDPSWALETAAVLKREQENPENIFLFGNHDLHYAYGSTFACSGFSPLKFRLLADVLGPLEWARFRIFHQHGKWTLSHAGFSLLSIAATPDQVWHLDLERMQRQEEIALTNAALREGHPWLRAGKARGGEMIAGGPLWLDYNWEFSPIAGVNQIFGHTEVQQPGRREGYLSDNHNLDTQFRHVGILRNDELEIITI